MLYRVTVQFLDTNETQVIEVHAETYLDMCHNVRRQFARPLIVVKGDVIHFDL